jgi:DNA-binding NtrC family response regulator
MRNGGGNSEVTLRLFRMDGLHGQIAMGETAVDLSDDMTFLLSDLVDRIMTEFRENLPPPVPDGAIPLNGHIVNLEWAEREIVRHALSFDDKSLDEVAEGLGLSRRGLLKKRRRFDFYVPERNSIGGNRPLEKKL